jgi:LPS export ABC transporter permease LptG
MGLITRTVALEILSSAFLGTVLFTFVLFLQRVTRLFEQLVRGSAPPETVAYLFALLLPPALTFTIPVGVPPSRRLLIPVLGIGLLGTLLTASASLWLTPWSIRQTYKLLNRIAAAQLTAEIQPRVFEEQFPNRILYVGDVIPGPVVQWKNVFLADLNPAEGGSAGPGEPGVGPTVTIAEVAVAAPDIERNRLQLSLVNSSTHRAGKEATQYYNSSSPRAEQVLTAAAREEKRPGKQYIAMDTVPLWREARSSVEADIELHQRLTLPLACLLLALVGVPLGVSTGKGGKSGAFVVTVVLAFLYYMSQLTLIGLARQGTLPPVVALWIPNAVLLIAGLWLVTRLERAGDRDLGRAIRSAGEAVYLHLRGTLPGAGGPAFTRFPLGPQLIDHYVLSSFVFYFLLLLTSFVVMTEVFTFFELLGDILRNNTMGLVPRYLLFLTPQLIYTSTPVSVLVAVLVTFGILTKNNEVTALKACGVSLYRLAIPVMVASLALSFALFTFDHYVIPDANRTQDALRAQIRGKPVQTYLRPDRKWIFGDGSRIYYYRYFEPVEGVMSEVNVYELDPKTFRLMRHVSAERARWEPGLGTWIFQNGWAREFQNSRETRFQPFPSATATFTWLREPPNWFLRELKQDKQMNFSELAAYIRDLQQSGFDTIRLQVQYHKKFAVPLFAVIMAIISVPFAFLSAHRGAMAGIGVSFGIAIAYWAVSQLFEQVGNINQLPAVLAAWAPDAVFTLAGLYFLARMKT